MSKFKFRIPNACILCGSDLLGVADRNTTDSYVIATCSTCNNEYGISLAEALHYIVLERLKTFRNFKLKGKTNVPNNSYQPIRNCVLHLFQKLGMYGK